MDGARGAVADGPVAWPTAMHVTARQLDLFKSRRQRGTLPPARLELASQSLIIAASTSRGP